MNRKMLAMSLGLLAITGTAISQELSIEVNGGVQGLHYDLPGGKAKPQAGGALGVGYMFPVQKHWNVLTGINGAYYATKATLNGELPYSSFQVDDAGSAFQYNIKTTNYQEKQTFWAVTVPLMLQYHTTGEKTQWYINGGAKFILPFSGKAKASASQIAVSGYYPDMNVELKELPAHGFGTIQNWSGTHNLDLKPGAMASLATGVSFPISSCMRLYTGVYADYGLTNVYKKDASGSMLPYSATGVNNIAPGTVLNMEGTGSAKPIAFGVQVKLGFGRKKSKPAPADIHAEPDLTLKELPPPAANKDTQKIVEPVPAVQVPDSSPAPTISDAEKATVQQPIEFGKIGSTTVPVGLNSRLDSIADIMKKYPDMRIAIVGHTCDIASAATNYKVGLKRAQEVAAYLEKQGIAADRIDVSSKGETQPLVPNTSEKNRKINRRVVITVL
ncbi:OmpA family protein [Pinibacter aurantiacus]|uniref:OmpA family protein n=1 Tax=Pinibacter aurantiacus TaxID=2851599 RepID=A0A9E2W856_9BACT|nr:OmpA family protein [Pinibacter aurantiacus]MBV4357602.1 OmpA family protein [Pinibacter aurantiacus]